MKIGLAQIHPVKGDINQNIQRHQRLIKLAIAQNIDAIFFPELSLTGYEPELANDLKIEVEDQRLEVFQNLSNQGNLQIGIGVPAKVQDGVQIAMFLFQPNQQLQKYAKQLLHEDEMPYFVKGKEQVVFELNEVKIAPAICYESLQEEHLEEAITNGANLYLASVAKSQSGIEKAMAYFPKAAMKHSIPILMTNCIGYCDNFNSVGQSTIWNKNGQLLEQLSDHKEGLLIYDTIQETTLIRDIKDAKIKD